MKRIIGIIWFFVLFVVLSTANATNAERFSASEDFSSTQGYRGWYYIDSNGNQLLWNAGRQWWYSPDEPYRLIWSWGGHPGDGIGVVRRWVAPKNGTVRINGIVRDADAGGGDGVEVIIDQGGIILWEDKIPNGFANDIPFEILTGVVAGDSINFVIKPGRNNWWDSTVFVPSIEFEAGDTLVLPPEPDVFQYIIVNVQDQGAEPRGPCTTFGVEQMAQTVVPHEGAGRKLGFGGLIGLWNMSDMNVRLCLQTFFQTAERFDMPLLIRLDAEHFWQDRPEFWNWWDITKPGYNPANRDNVEWSGWDTPTTKSYINWGIPILLPPRPCFESNAVREEIARKLRIVAEEVNTWRVQLAAQNRRYLFAGIDTGWETGIDNYIGVDWVPTEDQVHHGYCALSKRGFSAQNQPTDREFELASTVQDFARFEAWTLLRAGVPRHRLYTHIWGYEGRDAWHMHAPLWTAENGASRVGLSLYGGNYGPNDIGNFVAGKDWALVETGTSPEIYNSLLTFGPKLVFLYNWENGATGALRDNPYYIWALESLFAPK